MAAMAGMLKCSASLVVVASWWTHTVPIHPPEGYGCRVLPTPRPFDCAAQAVTLNNLACFEQARGNPGLALQHLHEALRLEDAAGAGSEASTTRAEDSAGTLLNLCAACSALGRHGEAARHARAAVSLLASAATGAPAGSGSTGAVGRVEDVLAHRPHELMEELPGLRGQDGAMLGSTLATAYYNQVGGSARAWLDHPPRKRGVLQWQWVYGRAACHFRTCCFAAVGHVLALDG